MSDFVDGLIKNADRLGNLGTNAVWGLFGSLMVAYIVWGLRNQRIGEKTNFEMRIKDADTDNAMANAVDKMADQIKELRYKLKCMGGKDE